MSKYEIMLIVDPKAEAKVGFDLVEEVFGKDNIKKAEKLELTDLAYKINGSLKAQYLLFNLDAESNLIAEFTRRSNIKKEIWRQLVINLDTEKGFGKPKKVAKKHSFFKKNTENREFKKPRVQKTENAE
ncbi:30S ribosomal protein S6, partial [Mycoplasmopsis iners]|uniref:30S ribosomal protein S6 n=1 Tax=Mycoplasmopsis iners TaxID=76630 RepID=UPI0004972F43